MLGLFRKPAPSVVVAPEPPVETAAVIEPVAPLRPATGRLSITETRDRLIAGSKLALAAAGEYDWREAYAEDMESARRFMNQIAEDLAAITGVELLVSPEAVSLSSLSSLEFDSMDDRIKAMASEFAYRLESNIRSLISMSRNYPIPICEPRWGKDRSSVAFEFHRSLDPPEAKRRTYGYEQIQIVYLNPAPKDRDDFTRKIPNHAHATFAALDRAHFEYRPKILDGFLAKMTRVEIRQVAYDPAILINLGTPEEPIERIVDFWQEPFDPDQPSLMRERPYMRGITLI